MPLDAAQITWLNRASQITPPLAGGAPEDGKAKLARALAEEEVRDQQRKTLLINDAMRVIDPLRPMLRDALDLQITNAKGKTKQVQAKDGQLAKTAESRQIQGSDKVSKGGSKTGSKNEPSAKEQLELVVEAGRAYRMINQLHLGLEQQTTTRSVLDPKTQEPVPGPAQRLFTTAEITDELFTPLIRARILPDTFVQGKFSKVQQMLDATNELYKEELTKVDDPSGGAASLLKAMVDFGGDLAKPIMEAAGVDSKLATGLLEGCVALAELSIDLGDKVHAGLDVDSVKDLLNGLPDIVGTLVTAATGDKTLGDSIGKAGAAGTAAIGFIITSVKAKKPDPAGLIDFFSAVLSAGLDQVDTGDDDRADKLKTLGDDIQGLVAKSASAHSEEFFAAIARGDMKGARNACKSVCIEIAASLPEELSGDVLDAGTSTIDMPDTGDQGDVGGDESISESMETVQDAVKEVRATIREHKEAGEELRQRLEEAAEGKLAELDESVDAAEKKRDAIKDDPEAFAASVQKELDAERKAFTDQLDKLNDPTADQKTVMKLIAKIQKDRAILTVAVTLGKGGMDLASHFFAPMALPAEAIKMAANIAAAVERAVYLRKFVDEKIGAANATSPYMTSIQNFVENQANQLTHYSIAAALNGMKMAAAAAAMAHPAAAPAVPIVAAMQSAAEALYKFHSANQVRKAWNTTKAALRDPNDRALGLQARKVNATLAKYAIAYGATVERDPIAVSMANACDIDTETLKNKDTSVTKVKIFFEIKFKDDPKVVGKYEDPAPWTSKLPAPALDAGVVFKTYKVVTDALGKTTPYFDELGNMPATPPNELIALLRTLQKQAMPTPPTGDAVAERLSVMGRVMTAFRAEQVRLAPIHEHVEAALEALTDLADHEQEALVMQLVSLKIAEAKAAKAAAQPQTRPRR